MAKAYYNAHRMVYSRSCYEELVGSNKACLHAYIGRSGEIVLIARLCLFYYIGSYCYNVLKRYLLSRKILVALYNGQKQDMALYASSFWDG